MYTIKTLIVVAVKKKWTFFQLDVNNAFLHGDLDEEVYMKLPSRLSVPSNSSWSRDSLVLLAIYVDDIVLTRTDLDEISALKAFLHAQFKIKDLGLLNYFLCIELHEKLNANMGDRLPSPKLCRSLIGKLNFLTHTRPDLSFSLQLPCVPHRKASLHLLRYLKGTSDFGLFFNNSSDFSLQVYYDSNLGSCPGSRRSMTSFCIMLGGSMFSWKSKKHCVVSLSSVEDDYRSLSKVVTDVTELSRLLSDFGFTNLSSIPVYCDN
ncbi:uncharacterized mitochondrial protein AtMg00810-like [Nicotiana sylvestris]|uniref:uncharacterized mitochondrial protein AtMg00810-like n=1 Tax=Nicotiana sylvestris TaxID=4096 RepID=UPI00388CB8DF